MGKETEEERRAAGSVMKINMAGIMEDSIVDGPGIRTAYFAQGCPHHCLGCQNPETWDFGTGTEVETEELAETARHNPLCRGVTFSGGEPFSQAEGFAELAGILKAEGYEVASYTGYTFEYLRDEGSEGQKKLLSMLDVLVDGPFFLEKKSFELPFRGSANQRIIDVQKSLASGQVVPAPPRWQGEY